ncbi:MAG: hypothetical protein NT033_00360 [Candidatus Omnitrophica bacterium]|nr:hypothetical protein [Candidatus Omnitrophota bacterium]
MGYDFRVKKIVFRADANPGIGTGDLVTLIYLSRYFLRKGWKVHFIVRSYPDSLRILKNFKIKDFFCIKPTATLDEEVGLINSFLQRNNISAIFLEITERKLTAYQMLLPGCVKAAVAFTNKIPRIFDLVVAWDPQARQLFKYKKRNFPRTKFLLGERYAVVAPDFQASRINRRKFASTPKKILITMGGIDEYDITGRVVSCLAKNDFSGSLTIVLGSGYGYKRKLLETLSSSKLRYTIKENLAQMFKEFIRSDVAVSAGGFTAFELLLSRTPSVLIAVAKHQIRRCLYFHRKRYAIYLGYRRFCDRALLDALSHPPKSLPKFSLKTKDIEEYIDEYIKRH